MASLVLVVARREGERDKEGGQDGDGGHGTGGAQTGGGEGLGERRLGSLRKVRALGSVLGNQQSTGQAFLGLLGDACR